MYKVILADDENQILDGLTDLIDWEDLHLVVAGLGNNGNEALDLIEVIRPQILITDIKMPGLDGIELIRRVKSQHPEIRCLVLSGFDDFSLVREAMRYGAENYLLKPVDREELLQNLKEIVFNLEENFKPGGLLWSGHRLLLNNLMNRIVRNDISHKEFRRKMEFLQVDIYNSAFVITVFAQPATQPVSAGGDIEIYEQLATLMEKEHRGIVFRDLAGHPVTLYFVEDQKDQQDMERLFLQFLMEKVPSWIAVSGDVVSSYRDLHFSYNQAMEGVYRNLFLPLDSYCLYRRFHSEVERVEQTAQVPMDSILQLCQHPPVRPPVSKIISSLPTGFRERRTMRLFCGLLLARFLFPFLDRKNPDICSEEVLALLKPVLSHFEMEEWETGLTNLLVSARELKNLCKSEIHSPLVDKLISHADDNFRDFNISLKTLAVELNISPEHAGRMFKKETGRFFSDYLSEIRIRHACEMLKGTSLPANDIALKVGFLNQNYFYTKFKKYTGQNPTLYRSSRGNEYCPAAGSFF